jgi:hypothetical protein
MVSSQMQSTNHSSPILVTGAHRTGTTWVGKMLAASGEAAYISEPLNVWHRPGVMGTPVNRWYTYICPDNEQEYLPGLLQTLAFRYHLWQEIQSLHSRKDFMRMGRDSSTFLRGRLGGLRPLLKDPFAVFSVIWFAQRLNCKVVITIRHPAAFASSLKRLDWSFQFEDLLAQPLLMRDLLNPYQAEIKASVGQDIIDQASLLWKMIYQIAARLQQEHPEFITVRHEDLSLEPLEGFQSLYDTLGLTFSHRARQAILDSSSSENPSESSRQAVHAFKLDSHANLQRWKSRLAPDEVERIFQLTGETAALYYSDESWE